MKRLLLIAVALLLNVWAAVALDYTVREITSVSVKDISTRTHYEYELTIKQNAYNSSGTQYASTAYIYIHPGSHFLPGTYSVNSNSITTNSYIKFGSNANRYFEGGTELTITDNKDGSYSVSGKVYSSPTSSTSSYNYTYKVDSSKGYCIFDVPEIETVKPNSDYSSEPNKKDFDFGGIDMIHAQKINDYIELDICKDNNTFALGFAVSGETIPAGTYNISLDNVSNTVIGSSGLIEGIFPDLSFVQIMDKYFNTDNYYLTSGSVTIAYENNGKDMHVTAETYSHNESKITIDASAANPFYVPEPETYVLDVSNVAYVTDLYDDSFFQLSIGATNNGKTCNGFILINSSTVPGDYDDDDIRNSSYFDNYMNSLKEDAENYVSIVATGNKEGNMVEYKLNLMLRMYDNNIYVIKDALFSVEEVVEPTPFDDEPEAGDPFTFELNIDAEPYCESENGTTVLRFSNSKYDKLVIAFPVSSMDKVVAGTYTIDSSNEEGTVIASPGILNWEYLPTVVEYGQGFFDSTPYFLTSGTVNVAYKDGKIFITGNVKSSKGSEITLNVSGLSPLEEQELPDNAFSGYLLGTGMNYFLAYDVTTNSNHTVTVSATLVLDEAVLALQPQVVIGTDTFDMSYDDTTGACEFTTTASYSKGNEIEISFNLHRSNTNVATDSFKYTVE